MSRGARFALGFFQQPSQEAGNGWLLICPWHRDSVIRELGRPRSIQRYRQPTGCNFLSRVDIANQGDPLAGFGRADQQEIIVERGSPLARTPAGIVRRRSAGISRRWGGRGGDAAANYWRGSGRGEGKALEGGDSADDACCRAGILCTALGGNDLIDRHRRSTATPIADPAAYPVHVASDAQRTQRDAQYRADATTPGAADA